MTKGILVDMRWVRGADSSLLFLMNWQEKLANPGIVAVVSLKWE